MLGNLYYQPVRIAIILLLGTWLIFVSCKTDMHKCTPKVSLFLSDVVKYVERNTGIDSCEIAFTECISEKEIPIENGYSKIFSEFRYVGDVPNIRANIKYRIDRIILTDSVLVLGLSYSSELDSSFCRVRCYGVHYKNVFISTSTLKIIYSSFHKTEESGLIPPSSSTRYISWYLADSKNQAYDEVLKILSDSLNKSLCRYQYLEESIIEIDSLNRL